MCVVFPHSDYYGGSVAVPDIQAPRHSLCRRSGLGNPCLGLLELACCDVGVGFSSFSADCGWSPRVWRVRPIHLVCRRGARLYNHPFAVGSNYAPSDCPSGSLAFTLVHNLSSRRSVVGRWFPQLTTFPICCTPRQVSPSDKLGDDSAAFSRRSYFCTAALPKAESRINPHGQVLGVTCRLRAH